jgi:hypothetical protein
MDTKYTNFSLIINLNKIILDEISGSYGDEYKDGLLLVCCTV